MASVAIGPVCTVLVGWAETERTGMGVAVRVCSNGAEMEQSGAGISGAFDAGGFGVGNGVDGLEEGGVGPRDTHGRASDGWEIGAALLSAFLDVAL